MSAYETAGRACQKKGGAGDVFRFAKSADRIGGNGTLVGFRVFPKCAREICPHKSGRDAVGANVGVAPLNSKIAGQLHVGGFGQAVSAQILAALQTPDAGNNDHRTITLFSHMRQHHVAEPEIAADVGIHDLVIGFLGDVGEWPVVRIDGCIADQNIDTSPFFERCIDKGAKLKLVGNIAGEGQRLATFGSDLIGDSNTALFLAAGDDNLGTCTGENAGDLLADAFGRAGDQGNFTGQVEQFFCVHAVSPLFAALFF
jgi:hypothetical protein